MPAPCSIMVVHLHSLAVDLNHFIIRMNQRRKEVTPSDLCRPILLACAISSHPGSSSVLAESTVDIDAIPSGAVEHLNRSLIIIIVKSICCFVKSCLDLSVNGCYVEEIACTSWRRWRLAHQATNPQGLLQRLSPGARLEKWRHARLQRDLRLRRPVSRTSR